MRLLLGLVASLLLVTTSAVSTGRFQRRDNGTAPYKLAQAKLETPWTRKVGTSPWPEYPRPLLERSNWKNLNGVWQYENVTAGVGFYSPPFGKDLAHSVLVPFCLESQLSGIGEDLLFYSFYRTTFDIPPSWSSDNRVLLNFGAVDYKTYVYVNGKNTSAPHVGGYDTFTLDITDLINKNGTNELFVAVYDPTDGEENGVQVQIPIGKQTLTPEHIFYTPCSGIWQTVWLESAPPTYVEQMHVTADMNGKLDITIKTNDDSAQPVSVYLFKPETRGQKGSMNIGNAFFTQKGMSDKPFSVVVDDVKLWSPDSPTLYPMTVQVGNDMFGSYVGFRTISRKEINGVQRPLLNGKFIFQIGTLDQGFWPDGIYSPPSVEAMRFDLVKLKEIGYNMVRKHIKVEPALWYKSCDELGLLVIQDMPSLAPTVRNPNSPKPKECTDYVSVGSQAATEEFGRQLEVVVQQLKNYPSIATWMIYNEKWGQPDDDGKSEKVFTERVKQLDPTRLVDTVSGWDDHGHGDFHDNHHYANPQCGTPFYSNPALPYDTKRIALQGEFAGIGHIPSDQNLWPDEKAKADIKYTYELDATVEDWNYRAHVLLSELREQIERYACSGAVWTQTTDVEGEVNGMLSYDRKVLRPDIKQWRDDIRALHEAAQKRGGEMVKVDWE